MRLQKHGAAGMRVCRDAETEECGDVHIQGCRDAACTIWSHFPAVSHTWGGGRGGGRGRNVCLWSCILLLTICISEMGLCLSSISTLFCGCLPCSGPLPMERCSRGTRKALRRERGGWCGAGIRTVLLGKSGDVEL